MKLNNFFITCVLLSASSTIYADCEENDFFGVEFSAPAKTTYEGKQALLDDEIADVPADWVSE